VVARGEVWWYEDERAGRRPFAILSRDDAIPLLNQVLAVPATQTIRGIPTEVELDSSDGMPKSCVLTLDNVTLVRRALCTERISTLSSERMQQVCEALRIATAC
jgi:mRNA interferase MazF